MTHDELVTRAGRWLRNTMRCGVVLTEFSSYAQENPDAIGWRSGGLWSYLIECKTSISDFYADGKKPGRNGKHALSRRAGIGREKYYMTPKGLLGAERVRRNRPGWGLLEVCGRSVRVVIKAIPFNEESRAREMPILYAYARRIHQYGLTLDDAQEAVRKAADARE